MQEYKERLRELAKDVLEHGLRPVEVIQDQIENSKSVVRYATGSEFAEVRKEHHAKLEVAKAELEAHSTGSLLPLMAMAQEEAPSVPVAATVSATEQPKPVANFLDLFKAFLDAKNRAGRWSAGAAKSNTEYAASLNKAMIATWGDNNCYSRSLADWEALQEAYLDNDNAPSTINKYMSTCKQILKYVGKSAGDNELVRLIDLKDDGGGIGYTPEQTKQLVQFALSGKAKYPELEQTIIIAAYTGMRLNEIMGLNPEDYIIEDGKVAGIIVRPNSRRTLKNRFSERVVPTPVWPTGWQPDVNLLAGMKFYKGDSSKFSTDYKRVLDKHLPELLLDEKGKRLVFHSHRHAAINRAYKALPAATAEATIAPIVGHGYKSESGKTYKEAFTTLDDVRDLVEPVRLMNEAIRV